MLTANDVRKHGLMLAHTLDRPEQLAGRWLASEKFDGIRVVWLPGFGLLTRTGNPIHAPRWFVEALPKDTALNGELVTNAGFQKVSSIVRRKTPVDSEWRKVKYKVFDSPTKGQDTTLQRLARVRKVLRRGDGHVQMVKQEDVVPSMGTVRKRMDNVVERGGEGLVLRKASAPYGLHRSHAFLKVKPERNVEGTVIGVQEGRGSKKGMLGALVLQLPQGGTFKVGSGFTDAQRKSLWQRPPLHSQVTVKFMTMTDKGVPRQPVFWRFRRNRY